MLRRGFLRFRHCTDDRGLPLRTVDIKSRGGMLYRVRCTTGTPEGVCSRAGDFAMATIKLTVRRKGLDLRSRITRIFGSGLPSGPSPGLRGVRLGRLLYVSDNFNGTLLVGTSEHPNINTPSCRGCVVTRPIPIRPNDTFYCSSTSDVLTTRVMRQTINGQVKRCLCRGLFRPLSVK